MRLLLKIVINARDAGKTGILVPAANAEETAVVAGLDDYAIETLRQAADFIDGKVELTPCRVDVESIFSEIKDHKMITLILKGKSKQSVLLKLPLLAVTIF